MKPLILQKVKKEFNIYLNSNLDFVGGLIKRANYFLKQGNLQKAIQGYEQAIIMDNVNNQARLDLANLYYRNQDFKKTEATYKTVISQEPKYGPVYYSLGLLYAELNRIDEATQQMEKASVLMPDNIRVYYNLSLLYEKSKSPSKAEKTILKGLKIDANNESLLYALAYHYSNNGEKAKTKSIALKLVQQYPGNGQYQALLQSVN